MGRVGLDSETKILICWVGLVHLINRLCRAESTIQNACITTRSAALSFDQRIGCSVDAREMMGGKAMSSR